jgi:erythritol/L-threitol dehydrogenase
MKALVYHRSVPRYLLSQLVSRFNRKKFFPKVSPLALEDWPFSPPKGWATLTPLLCGICGSDVNLLKGHESFLLEPYASLPAVLGHEIVAKVDEAPEGSGFSTGDRVAVEPVLPCETRNLPPCPQCAAGNYNLCSNFLSGDLPPGSFLGYNSAASGGMAERTAAHPSRMVRLPDSLSDEDAALIDSMASALHPLLWSYPENGQNVVVYGAGILGQHVTRLLRALGSKARIIAVARHRFQAELCEAGGADMVLRSPDRKALAEAVGGHFIKTTLGGGNIEGGADVFIDCVGNSRSVQEGLLALRARGRYVMVGTASTLSKVDASSIWFRELRLAGSAAYSQAPNPDNPQQYINVYRKCVELLASKSYATQGLITHSFRLPEYKKAFAAAFDKGAYKSMKVVFDLRGSVPA